VRTGKVEGEQVKVRGTFPLPLAWTQGRFVEMRSDLAGHQAVGEDLSANLNIKY